MLNIRNHGFVQQEDHKNNVLQPQPIHKELQLPVQEPVEKDDVVSEPVPAEQPEKSIDYFSLGLGVLFGGFLGMALQPPKKRNFL